MMMIVLVTVNVNNRNSLILCLKKTKKSMNIVEYKIKPNF
jgi:hypothetical protein